MRTALPQLSSANASWEESATATNQAATVREEATRLLEDTRGSLQRALGESQTLRREAEGAAARLQEAEEELAGSREEAAGARSAVAVMPVTPPASLNWIRCKLGSLVYGCACPRHPPLCSPVQSGSREVSQQSRGSECCRGFIDEVSVAWQPEQTASPRNSPWCPTDT